MAKCSPDKLMIICNHRWVNKMIADIRFCRTRWRNSRLKFKLMANASAASRLAVDWNARGTDDNLFVAGMWFQENDRVKSSPTGNSVRGGDGREEETQETGFWMWPIGSQM